jgi:hypothetical protein
MPRSVKLRLGRMDLPQAPAIKLLRQNAALVNTVVQYFLKFSDNFSAIRAAIR